MTDVDRLSARAEELIERARSRAPVTAADQRMRRRREAEVLGTTVIIASAEDIVLSKLEWAKMAGSERQITDEIALGRQARASRVGRGGHGLRPAPSARP